MSTPYTNVKDTISQADLARFAICFMHTKDKGDSVIDWAAAANDFNPEHKAASFKTVTMRALKRVIDAAANEDGSTPAVASSSKTNGTQASTPKGKGKAAVGGSGGRKRKAATPIEDSEDEITAVPVKKESPKKKAKKVKSQVKTEIKPEADGEDADGEDADDEAPLASLRRACAPVYAANFARSQEYAKAERNEEGAEEERTEGADGEVDEDQD